jgi:hypothetical protein
LRDCAARGGAGRFVAGSTSSDLIGLAERQGLGLCIVVKDERARGYYGQGCDGLCAAAREFCRDIDESMSPCSRRCLPVMAESKQSLLHEPIDCSANEFEERST